MSFHRYVKKLKEIAIADVSSVSSFGDRSVKKGHTITIIRAVKNSPYEVDRPDFKLKNVADSLL